MRLAGWSTHVARIPYRRAVRWASTEVTGAEFVVLRLVADDGRVGIAEGGINPFWNGVTARSLPVVLEELLIPRLEGVDLLDEAAVERALGRIPEHRLARSMVDTACWDLRAQAAGVPLWQLWGGDPDVPVSWTVTRQAPAAMAREAAEMVGQYGFRTLKLKGGQGWERDFQMLGAVRAAVGPDVALYVDANGAYPPDEALAYVERLAEHGVVAAEDPCPLQPNRAFARLQAASPMPLVVDHACNSVGEAALFLEQGARALSVKLSKAGPTECRRMAALADAAGCQVHVGVVAESTLGALIGLQVAGALPARERSLPAELTFFLMLTEEYTVERLTIQDGRVRLPAAPGLAQWVDWGRLSD
ncbi:MAG TPA: enolase C-terminal domain-like protein [Chloroflexota bacterium]|nr:enolase C-terminal domain-like protein [Chloroflexota bacterium]